MVNTHRNARQEAGNDHN
jgi:hypothetical protein